MRKLVAASLLAVTLILILAPASFAGGRHRHGGTRVFVSVGPRFWWGGPWWGPPWWGGPWGPPHYVYSPPPVIVQEPPVYVQQQVTPAPTPPPAPAAPSEGFWHYCPSAHDYYPNVQTCPEAWVKVPPRQE
jgi:hypothetical protein